LNLTSHSNQYDKWLAVAVIWVIACLNYADRMAIFSVLPVLKREMGFSDVALALLGSTFLWTYALCSPIGGYLGDRFSRRLTIISRLAWFTMPGI
jgi:MFS family permease